MTQYIAVNKAGQYLHFGPCLGFGTEQHNFNWSSNINQATLLSSKSQVTRINWKGANPQEEITQYLPAKEIRIVELLPIISTNEK